MPRRPRRGSRSPGELFFEFVRVSDRKLFRCELRFHGESYGWEAQWFDDGGLRVAWCVRDARRGDRVG
jgi:hypothetical protein